MQLFLHMPAAHGQQIINGQRLKVWAGCSRRLLREKGQHFVRTGQQAFLYRETNRDRRKAFAHGKEEMVLIQAIRCIGALCYNFIMTKYFKGM